MKACLVAILLLTVCGCASSVSPVVRKDLRTLFGGSYSESIAAWHRLEKTEAVRYGQTPKQIIALMGEPGYRQPDFFCYKTAGGVVEFEFSGSGMICRRLVSQPVRWRGTDEEAERLWQQRRDDPRWYCWDIW